MEFIKKNVTLVLGIAIPILMILFVAASIYLPRLFIQPHFNFLYVSVDDKHCNNPLQYAVQNNKLVQVKVALPKSCYYSGQDPSKLYLYDVAKNESREISFANAQNLNLDPTEKSPEGFQVVYGNRNEGFFSIFFGPSTDYSTLYLTGHNVSKKLNLQLNGPSYYDNFRFLGWVK